MLDLTGSNWRLALVFLIKSNALMILQAHRKRHVIYVEDISIYYTNKRNKNVRAVDDMDEVYTPNCKMKRDT